MDQPLYPNITVKLVGTDGNAYALMGKVVASLRRELQGTMEQSEINQTIKDFQTEAMSGDYDNLLRTCMKFVDVE